MKLRTGIVPGCFEAHFGPAEKYAVMKSMGFDCSDFQHFVPVEDPLYAMTPGEFERFLKEERRMAEAAGVSFYQVHSPWRCPPRDDTPEDRAFWLEAMKTAVRGTALLGAPYMVFHSLMPGINDPSKRDPVFFRQVNDEFIGALLAYAKSWGVTICMENMPMKGLPICTDTEVLEYVRGFDDSGIAMCLDTGHTNVHGVRPGDALRRGADKIKVLHIHDNSGWADSHEFPYLGTVDWADFVAAVAETGFSGVLSLETSPSGKTPWYAAEPMLRALAETLRHFQP